MVCQTALLLALLSSFKDAQDQTPGREGVEPELFEMVSKSAHWDNYIYFLMNLVFCNIAVQEELSEQTWPAEDLRAPPILHNSVTALAMLSAFFIFLPVCSPRPYGPQGQGLCTANLRLHSQFLA